MNQYKLKIVNATPIEDKLDDTQDYSVVFKRCAIKSVKRVSDGVGEYVYTYSAESLDDVTILGAGGTMIKGKGKSASQRLRNLLYAKATEKDVDSEEYYQRMMNKIMANIDQYDQE